MSREKQTPEEGLVTFGTRESIAKTSQLIRRGLGDILKLSGTNDGSHVDRKHKTSRPSFDEETQKKSKTFFYRGRTKQDNGDVRGAIVDFDKAIEIDPRFDRYYFRRGAAKQTSGDLDGAIADYTKAIEIHPQSARAYNNRGVAKQAKGDVGGALSDFDKAIETHPKYAEAYINRGGVKQGDSDLDGAIADYTNAIQIDPHGTDVYHRPYIAMAYAFRGLACLSLARVGDAKQDFTKCLELDGSQEAWIETKAEEIREKRADSIM